MRQSRATIELLASLDKFSHSKLTRRHDLGVLIELSALGDRTNLLEEISFLAKFISKTFGIMTRIGKKGEGYEKLLHEFHEAIGKMTTLLHTLLQAAPAATRQHFSLVYLCMTQESVQHLLALCYDLSWYKNWLIDNPEQRRHSDKLP